MAGKIVTRTIIVALSLLASAGMFGVGAIRHAHAQTFGDGVAAYSLQQFERAREIWQKLAEEGMPDAQFRLGMLYQEGRGTEQDVAEAVRWYREAGEAGHSQAQYTLATILKTGSGVAPDPKEAFRWYLKAAQSGVPHAQFEVAADYMQEGGAVERDLLESYLWFSRAADSLSREDERALAADARDRTYNALTAEQKRRAAERLGQPVPELPARSEQPPEPAVEDAAPPDAAAIPDEAWAADEDGHEEDDGEDPWSEQ